MNAIEMAADIIRRFEHLELRAYDDRTKKPVPKGGRVLGKLTIGFGHTRGVKAGDVCTREQAEAWLLEDIGRAWAAIERALPVVSSDLKVYEKAALVSLVFNAGGRGLQRGTLLRAALEAPGRLIVPDRMRLYNKAKVNGKLQEWPGLTKRRWVEAVVFGLPLELELLLAPELQWAIDQWPRRLQACLWLAGHDPGLVDGDIGPKTREAIRAFQRSQAGLFVDGRAEGNTVPALVQDLAQRYGGGR